MECVCLQGSVGLAILMCILSLSSTHSGCVLLYLSFSSELNEQNGSETETENSETLSHKRLQWFSFQKCIWFFLLVLAVLCLKWTRELLFADNIFSVHLYAACVFWIYVSICTQLYFPLFFLFRAAANVDGYIVMVHINVCYVWIRFCSKKFILSEWLETVDCLSQCRDM